ncbi:Interferon regulatory factor 4-like protein [Aix galericulata]|nr:Interferon regulatory factor 4-like protein [Aix galericulata]
MLGSQPGAKGPPGAMCPCSSHPHQSQSPREAARAPQEAQWPQAMCPPVGATSARSPRGCGQAAWARDGPGPSIPVPILLPPGAPRFCLVPPGSAMGRERGDPRGSVGSPGGARRGAPVPRQQQGAAGRAPRSTEPPGTVRAGGVPGAHRCPRCRPHPSRGRDAGGAAEEPKAASGKTKAKVPDAPSLSPPRRAPEGTAGPGRARGSMAEPGSPMRLKEWLIAQIDSGRYPGLRWEDGRRTLFRIPWKHAAKQDYRQQQDAALFRVRTPPPGHPTGTPGSSPPGAPPAPRRPLPHGLDPPRPPSSAPRAPTRGLPPLQSPPSIPLSPAWAVYKGKYHEGTDKADPSTWKTRLRCALNKSTDFQEVPERSQLDISEPYKVYQIVSDGARDAGCVLAARCVSGLGLLSLGSPRLPGGRSRCLWGSGFFFSSLPTENDGGPQPPASEDPQGRAAGSPAEEGVRGAGGSCHTAALPLLSAHPAERGYHVRGAFYGWNPTHGHFLPRPSSYLPVEDVNHSDCWLHVRLYYCDVLVKELTTRTAEGCRIASRAEPADSERLYGPSCMEQIEFPPPRALGGSSRVAGVTEVLERLLPHLERGVLLWVAPEGVFMKRQCQGRVYWNGPLAPHRDWPNKLEREKTYKLLDTQQFLQQLRRYLSQGQPAPQYQIHLCFGEEYPTSASHHFQKLIMAHVEPVFARELFHHAQRIGPTLLRDCPQPCAPGAPGHIVHVLQQLCQP